MTIYAISEYLGANTNLIGSLEEVKVELIKSPDAFRITFGNHLGMQWRRKRRKWKHRSPVKVSHKYMIATQTRDTFVRLFSGYSFDHLTNIVIQVHNSEYGILIKCVN